jgi:hypothetical protein
VQKVGARYHSLRQLLLLVHVIHYQWEIHKTNPWLWCWLKYLKLIMGSTFGLVFSISHFIFFNFDLSRHLQHQRGIWWMKNLCQFHQGFVTFSCINIYHHVDGSIFLMVTWPKFLRYVITYHKGEHNRQKRIRNLRKLLDVHRCINLYIGKFYCVRNMYDVRWSILVYVNMCLMMYLINLCLCVWWL